MDNIKYVISEINEIVRNLIDAGLADNFTYPSTRNNNDQTVISFKNDTNISISLKNISYEEIYKHLSENKSYNIMLPDGGLLLFQYTFDKDGLYSHRLCFFPSPFLEEFQNSPDVYLNEEFYGDVVNKNIVIFPIRFDYKREVVESSIYHPKSHGTFGQYKNCRIPVSGPLSPKIFAEFILDNFYSVPYTEFNTKKIKGYCKDFINTFSEKDYGKLCFIHSK